MLPSHANRIKGVSLGLTSNEVKTNKKGKNPKVILFAIVGYMSCSSLMLIGNKVAVYNIPAPSFILWAQMLSCGMILTDIYYIINDDYKMMWIYIYN